MAVDDHGLEVLKKSGEEVTPGDKSDLFIKVKNTNPSGSAVIPQQVSDSGTTGALVAIGNASEVEITAATGQQNITIINVSNQKVHYTLDTGVDTTFDSLSKGDQLIKKGYAGSIFLIAASGTPNVQVNRDIKS